MAKAGSPKKATRIMTGTQPTQGGTSHEEAAKSSPATTDSTSPTARPK